MYLQYQTDFTTLTDPSSGPSLLVRYRTTGRTLPPPSGYPSDPSSRPSARHFLVRPTRSSRHTVISSQASTVQSYGWAMLNYEGEADEAGNGYTASFVAAAIFQDTP